MPELINCRVCGHQISTSAKSCPNCVDEISFTEKISEKIDTTGIKEKGEKIVGTLKLAWVIGMSVLIAFGVLKIVNWILDQI